MANVPEVKEFIQLESVLTREPLGEFLEQGMGGSINFLLTRDTKETEWKANGVYRQFVGKLGTDGVWVAPFDCSIFNVIIGHKSGGTSGTTTVDIKRSTDNGANWSTIFTTQPAISPSAAAFGWCGIGQTVTGFTAPVLIGAPAPFDVNYGDGFRMDITSVMDGSPTDLWIVFNLQTR